MSDKKLKMPLPSIDDLLEGVPSKDIFTVERAIKIPIEKLLPFPNHPFKVQKDEEMEKMAESIKENGVLHPLIVRQKEDGNYYLKEDPNTKWHPTDLHTLTTLTAFPHITKESPWINKSLREIGMDDNELMIMIIRDDNRIIPNGKSIIKENDIVLIYKGEVEQ